MKLSIVIVSWNVRDLLERCLRSIAERAHEISHEVIVIDNASSDGSVEMVREKFPSVKLIANNENRGFAAACNQGIAESAGEYLFFLNPDSEITSGLAQELITYLDTHPDVGIVAPQVRNADGSVQPSIQRFPTPLSQLGVLFKVQKFFPRLLSRYYATDFDYTNDEQDVDQPDGAALLVCASALHHVGGFDERFFLWFDEVDLCRRFKNAGWRIVYCSRGHIIHHSGRSFAQKGILEKQRLFFTSCAQYLRKHCGGSGLFVAAIMNIAVAFFSVLDAAISLIRQPNTSCPPSVAFIHPHQRRLFARSLCAIIAVELLSLGGYFYGPIDALALGLLAAATFLITFRRLEYGVAILFVELIIGSKGYLFSIVAGDMRLSVRMVLFGAIIAGWLLKMLADLPRKDSRGSLLTFRHASLRRWYALLGVAVIIGIGSALRNGNTIGYIVADANAWFFFLILPVLYDALQTREQIVRFLTIGASAVSASLIKVMVVFYMMGHRGFGDDILTVVYRWIRSTGVGELTQMDSLYRIFFQSQMYVVIVFFVLLSFSTLVLRIDGGMSLLHHIRRRGIFYLFFSGSLASLILSFSRSFWVGVGLVGIIFSFGVFVSVRRNTSFVIRYVSVGMLSVAAALFILFAISAIPIPSREGVFSIDLLSERVENLESEAAAASRWNLLPIMLDEIKKHPWLGYGHGKTLTYTSKDPRVLLQNESGEYKTYAFEWGYLDLWLKMGLLGLLVYLALLGAVVIRGANTLKQLYHNDSIIDAALVRGLLFGLSALMIIHFFTPYLNHPLGIGIVMLTAVLSERLRHSERSPVIPSAARNPVSAD